MDKNLTLSELDTLTATVGQMTPGDVTACKSSLGGTLGLAEDTPATIRKYSTDEQGRRVTQFIAELHGARLPNDANAEGFAALKNAAPALLHAARTLETVRDYVTARLRQATYDKELRPLHTHDLRELLTMLDAAPAQEK